MASGVCAAQQSSQFNALPYVQTTGGRVTSILSGTFQYQSSAPGPDILYINAPTKTVAGVPAIVAGALINDPPGFLSADADEISFTNVSNVVAASADFDSDGKADFAFALSPLPGAISGGNYICVYYGTGANSNNNNFSNNGVSSYDGGNAYPPKSGKSGCMTFAAQGNQTPYFAYIAALPFTTGGLPQLLVEDSANNYLYVFSNSGQYGGTLPGFTLIQPIPITLADGAGPIYTGSFDNKTGNFDNKNHAFFIINGQAGHTATVYIGDGTGVFTAQPPLTFDKGVYSMLLQDMDGDGKPDMVVEGKDGSIEIFPGDGKGGFSTTSEGGTAAGTNALTGNGGHLAAISNINTSGLIEILTSTPIGLSVLENSGSYSPNYTLKNIYNIGPGRSSFALASFYGGYPVLAVDSAEGVALIQGNADGSFQTSLAYSALAPALGATIGQFRKSGNPFDVVVATGTGADAIQAQLLTNNGDGTYATYAKPTNTTGPPSGIAANLWPNILSGDFNGDGVADLAYSLIGNPLPAPAGTGTGLYVQYGVGDGTFTAPVAVSAVQTGNNNFYGESAVGLFNSDGIADIAHLDSQASVYEDTLLGQSSGVFKLGLDQSAPGIGISQVAAGYFATGRVGNQDLIFQQGAALVPYVNNRDGTGKTFNAMNPLTGPFGNYAITTVLLTDIDGDGNGDILALYHKLASDPSNPVSTAPNWLYIWWGNGDGTFTQPFTLQLSRNYYLAVVADMNGDKLPDIVLSDGYLVSVLYNQDSGSPVNHSFGNEAHFLAGQGINSLTLQSVRGSTVPDLVVANGGATISNPIVLGGVAQASATLPANPEDVNTGGITVLLNNITALPTTGTLAALPEPSIIGEAFTITATLTPSSGKTPTGSVTFYIDNTTTPVCTVVPAASTGTTSTAQCTVPAGNSYLGGVHPMTAVYGGDPNNAVTTLTGPNGTHNILDVTTTTQIFFCIGPAAGCPAPPAVVTPPAASSLTMFYGQYWNGIIETSSSDNSAMTGNVDLNDDYNGVTSTLCVLPVTGGACDPSVGTTVGTAVGTNILTGVYLGDASHEGSSSTPVAITVLPDTTSNPTLAGSPQTSPVGQPVTFTATLTGNYAPPAGTVTFYELNPNTSLQTPIGSGTLTAGSGLTSTATFTTSSLPVGADSITASYAATTDFAAASFPIITETITSGNTTDFTVSATPNPASAGVGYAALLTVTVTANNGFAESVNLSCGNLPTEATCIFAPAATPSGGGMTTLIVETTAPHDCGTEQPYFLGGNGGGPHLAPFALPALAGLVAFLIPGKRRWLRSLMALIAVAAIAQMTGCSTCTDLGTKPATYTFQVIGTSAVTGEVQSRTVTLNVTI
jgi:hypothetical protein